MRRRNFLMPVVAFVGIMLFICIMVRLLLLRYERGDVYPAYSTHRADPLGSRAFYEALESLDGYPLSRGFTSLHRELEEKPGTLFYLGFNSSELFSFTKEEVKQLDAYVRDGGRVIITLEPEDPWTTEDEDSKDKAEKAKAKADAEKAKKKEEANKDKTKPPPPPESAEEPVPTGLQTQEEKYERDEHRKEVEANKDQNEPIAKYERSLPALWGFGWDVQREETPKKPADADSDADFNTSDDEKEKPEVLAVRSGNNSFEQNVPWKSAIYIVRLEPEWEDLYDAKKKPVMVRRAWGKGEIILATDSYLISNEALRNDRRPALLNALAGPQGKLIFDETHLGTQEQDGVMFLMNKFRLEGYFYGLVGVVLLFLWRNSVPLVPPRHSGGRASLGGAVSGKDSKSGLVNLLRRNIPRSEILKTSFTQWKRSVTPSRPHLHEKMKEMETILFGAETKRADGIVQTYHQLREINTPASPKEHHATKS